MPPLLFRCRMALLGSGAVLAAADGSSPGRALSVFGSKVTADASNPTLAGGMPFMMPGLGGNAAGEMPMMTPGQEAEVTQDSSEFVAAAITAFLNKQHLPQEEMQCIEEGSGDLGGNVGRVAGQFALVAKKAFGVSVPLPDGVGPDAVAAPAFAGGSSLDGAGSISDRVNQIVASQSSPPQGRADSSPSTRQLPSEHPDGDDNSVAPQAGQRQPDTAQQGGGPAASPGEITTSKDPSLSFFFNGGRRLQLLPGMPSGHSGGASSMMGPQAFPMVMELGISIEQITKELHELVGKCIHSDAKEAMRKAGEHAQNLDYITGHFLANGADIVDELADSVMAYEKQNATQFGRDFGKAMRKIFLSNNAEGKLPEGLPGNAELGNVTSGLLKGFFGRGTFMDIDLAKDPRNPLHIDMQHCVDKNLNFFQQIWGSTMYLFAQGAAGVGGSSATASSTQGGGLGSDAGKLQFGTVLAMSMMELPGAMGKCGIDKEHEGMIMNSVKSLGSGMRAKFELPDTDPSKKKLTNDLANTVKVWSENNWYDFGKKLGALMQESAVKFHPDQKYDRAARKVDVDGPAGVSVLGCLLTATLVSAAAFVALGRRMARGCSHFKQRPADDYAETRCHDPLDAAGLE